MSDLTHPGPIQFHTEILDNPAVRGFSREQSIIFYNLLLVAGLVERHGWLPPLQLLSEQLLTPGSEILQVLCLLEKEGITERTPEGWQFAGYDRWQLDAEGPWTA